MTKWGELLMRRCSLLVGLKSSSQSLGVLDDIMVVTGGDEFDVICIEEAVC